MALLLNRTGFDNVSKRIPQQSTSGSLGTATTMQLAASPDTRKMTAGGVVGALENLASEQTVASAKTASQEAMQDITQRGDAMRSAQSVQSTSDSLDLQRRAESINETGNQLKLQLSQMDRSLSGQLWDEQASFERDEIGRVFFKERQLADYMILNAKSQEDYMVFEQNVMNVHDMKMQMLTTAHAKLKQTMEQSFQSDEQLSNQGVQKALSLMKAVIEGKIAKEQADAAITAAWISGGISTLTSALTFGVAAP